MDTNKIEISTDDETNHPYGGWNLKGMRYILSCNADLKKCCKKYKKGKRCGKCPKA